METVDYILSKMREPSCFKGKIPVERVDADFRDFADRLDAAIKREREAVGKEEDVEIREGILKSIAECDTSITGWSVTYPPGGTIAKVEIPRAVYEMLLAAFREVCRAKLVLRKDEGAAL